MIEMYLHHKILHVYELADVFISPSKFLIEKVKEMGFSGQIEHLANFELLMSDIVRILKKDGFCNVFVPHFSNPYYFSDYSHIRTFGLYTFFYFVREEDQLGRKVPTFYNDIRIDIKSVKLVFRSVKNHYFRTLH